MLYNINAFKKLYYIYLKDENRYSADFILGKPEREPIEPIETDFYPYRYSMFERGEGTEQFPYLKKGQCSYITDRDFQQDVGKLYKGIVDDDDEDLENIKTRVRIK